MNKQRKTVMNRMTRKFTMLLALLGTCGVHAQDDISGVWAGNLQVAPDTQIAVHFTITQENGAWSAVLNSPDMGAIKNIPASAVSYDAGQLAIEVSALSGAYSGSLENGTFNGEWTQPGGALPMNLEPYEAPLLTEEGMAVLMGPWNGKLMGPGVTFTIAINFSRNEAGEFIGQLTNVDAGNQQIAMADITLEGDQFQFRVPQAQAEYKGVLSGDSITGSLQQGPQPMVLNFSRGEAVVEVPQLSLTDADFEQLSGRWSGTLGPLTLVLRVERNAAGTIVAFIDSPTQGANGLRITSASLVDGKLDVALAAPPASFSGTLQGNVLDGSWNQGGMSNPLQLTKE
jgi:hypothetical protein